VNHQLLDDRFIGKSISGYTYTISGDQFSYTAIATPLTASMGRYEYYMVVDGVIRYSTWLTLAPVGKSGNGVH